MKPLFTVPAWLAGLIQAGPDLGLSAVFLITWLRPDTFGPHGVKRLVLVMLLPRFGITPQVVQSQQFSGGGLWIDQPQTAIAFGFLYFLVVGLGEMLLVRRQAASERTRRQ